MKTTGIIVPCYNEYYRLEKEKFCNFISKKDNYHLCFVNDGSSDKTLEMLYELKSFCPERISVVDMKENQGKATAVQNGANFLKAMPFIDNIAFLDADLSTSLDEMDTLVQKLNENPSLTMVFGSRKSEEAANIDRSILRKVFSSIVGFFIRFVLQLPIKDTQCGAKVFKREIISNVYNQKFISRWLFDIEIFLRLKKHLGLHDLLNSIREEPLDSWIEVEGSKITLKDSFLIPFNLLLIWFNYRSFDLRSNNLLIKTKNILVNK